MRSHGCETIGRRTPGWLLALCLVVLTASQAAAQLREGSYALSGRTPAGAAYEGTVTLRGGPGGTWLVAWQVGNARVVGLGVVRAGVLAVSFEVNGTPGVAAYDVDAAGRINGVWTSGDGLGTETFTPAARPPR